MSDLARLANYPPTTTLIARSGIQFLDFGLDPARGAMRDWGFVDSKKGGGLDDLLQLDYDSVRGVYEIMEQGRRREVEPNLLVGPRDAMAPFLDRWVPVPYLHVRGGGYKEGPANWARVRVVDLEARYGVGFRDDGGLRYRCALAFDTNLLPELDGQVYLAPSPKDVTSGATFELAALQRDNHWYLRQTWLAQWIEDLFAELFPKASADELEHEIKQSPQEPVARYLAFLGLLRQSAGLPRVKMVGDAERPGRGAIDVDLVLDVGNSRTCGMLIESAGERAANLNDSYELALRDLSHPERVYTKPFESRIEFAHAGFGKADLSRRSGRSEAFVWPTMARIGPEAARLAARRRGTEGNTGMSSPKRYLWDVEPQKREWFFNDVFAREGEGQSANSGPLAQLINHRGEPLHNLPANHPDNLPVFEPLYSRSSMMTFVVCEILLQALTQMNAPAQRGRRSHADSPRRLRRVVMTVPTGMPLAERQIFKRRAETARDLVWMVLGWRLDDPDAPKPEVFLEWDEATCTQAVYLYTEVARNWGGDARRFFAAAHKPRLRPPATDTLRVASIDIGGGSSDLIINSYKVEGTGTSVTLTPRQEFREGFNKAGDDILLRIIQHHVLPPIERAMREAGVAAPDSLLAELLGGDRGGEDVEQRNLKRQFALQIAMPIGLALLQACETYDPLVGTASETPRSFDSFFPAGQQPLDDVVRYLHAGARRRGGVDFDLRKVVFPVDLAAIDETIQAEIQGVLTPLCEVVHALDCDVLLLSGRPSRLPAIRTLVLKLFPLPPDRVIAMHEYRVGTWYPFRDARLRIDDPKTTVAVGAMVCVLGQSQLPGFAFRADTLHAKSTARFIGKIEGTGRLLREDVYYANVDLDDPAPLPPKPIEFRGPMTIGFRQLDLERWPTTRLYALEYAGKRIGDELSLRTPLQVVLARSRQAIQALERGRQDAGLHVESFEIERITDATGSDQRPSRLTLRLQTLAYVEGYWLDTGMLRTA
jgi:hypothetical protein